MESAMVGRDVDETVLMEKAPATSGQPARWLIRQGQYITVGELFVSGARRCSCWALQGKGVERPGFNSLGWWHICPALCCQRSIFLRLLTKLSAAREVPATGGKSPRGLIRQAVGEFFVFGARRCSCWALYRIHKSSDIFIRKEQHSVSGSEGAVVLQNAKRKRHLDTGKFGLDW